MPTGCSQENRVDANALLRATNNSFVAHFSTCPIMGSESDYHRRRMRPTNQKKAAPADAPKVSSAASQSEPERSLQKVWKSSSESESAKPPSTAAPARCQRQPATGGSGCCRSARRSSIASTAYSVRWAALRMMTTPQARPSADIEGKSQRRNGSMMREVCCEEPALVDAP